MKDNFLNFCEELFKEWITNNQNGELESFKKSLASLSKRKDRTLFDLEFLPEPYLTYLESDGQNDKPIVFLNNNPGEGMAHQGRQNILSELSWIKKSLSYSEISTRLGKYYQSEQFKKDCGVKPSAPSRAIKLVELARGLGYKRVLSVETIPFHSKALDKKKALGFCNSSDYYNRYYSLLKEYLSDKPVVIISGISPESIKNKSLISKWLEHQAKLIDFSFEDCILIPFKEIPVKDKSGNISNKEKKTTTAILVQKNKIITLMDGHNNLPNINPENLKKIKKYFNN